MNRGIPATGGVGIKKGEGKTPNLALDITVGCN
jgi:hypothetical protein